MFAPTSKTMSPSFTWIPQRQYSWTCLYRGAPSRGCAVKMRVPSGSLASGGAVMTHLPIIDPERAISVGRSVYRSSRGHQTYGQGTRLSNRDKRFLVLKRDDCRGEAVRRE